MAAPKTLNLKRWGVLIVLVLISSPARALNSSAGTVKVERSLRCMGTEFKIDAYGTDASVLEGATEDAFDEVKHLDLLLSNYLPDSELSRVNQQAADGPVVVSRELFDFLLMCQDYSRQSEGSFDITVGPLMKIWGFYKGSGHLPHRAEVRTALAQIGFTNVQLESARPDRAFY